jgi:hypothetical protein
MTEKNTRRAIVEAIDILSALRDRHFLLECLNSVFGDCYFDADPETKRKITNLSTVLAAYDHRAATDSLDRVIALLEDAL